RYLLCIGFVRLYDTKSRPLMQPECLFPNNPAVDGAGKLYGADPANNWVQNWTPGSQSRSTAAPGRRASSARSASLLRKRRRGRGWPSTRTSNGPNRRMLKGGAAASALTPDPRVLSSRAIFRSFEL